MDWMKKIGEIGEMDEKRRGYTSICGKRR